VQAQSSRDLTEPTGTEANRLRTQAGGYYGGGYRAYAYVPRLHRRHPSVPLGPEPAGAAASAARISGAPRRASAALPSRSWFARPTQSNAAKPPHTTHW